MAKGKRVWSEHLLYCTYCEEARERNAPLAFCLSFCPASQPGGVVHDEGRECGSLVIFRSSQDRKLQSGQSWRVKLSIDWVWFVHFNGS